MLLNETHFKYQNTISKGIKKKYYVNTNQKKSWSSYIHCRQNKLQSKENDQG